MKATGLTICVFLLLLVGGCNECLDGFRAIQVGRLLPERSRPRLYRTGIGVGALDFGWTLFPLSSWDRSLHVLTDDSGRVVAKEYYSCSMVDVPPVCIALEERTLLEVQVPTEWWRDPPEGWRDRLCRYLGVGQRVRDLLKRKSPAEQREVVRQWRAWFGGELPDPTDFFDALNLSPKRRQELWAHDVISRAPNAQRPELMREYQAWRKDRLVYAREFLRRLRRMALHGEGARPPEATGCDVMQFIEIVEQLVEAVPLLEGTVDRPDNMGIAGRGVLHELYYWDQYDDGQVLDLRGVTQEGFDWEGKGKTIRMRVRNLGGRRIRIEVVRKWAQGHLLWPLTYGSLIQGLSHEFSMVRRSE